MIETWNSSRDVDVKPDVVTFRIVANACSKSNQPESMQRAERVLRWMKEVLYSGLKQF